MTDHGFGLYVHWPYCARICPYCDFNVYKTRSMDADLVDAIGRDLEYWRELSGARALTSIHFGGGTPSLMLAAHLAEIIEKAIKLWSPVAELEIAIEANPNDISTAAIQGWLDIGINRVSIGVQSFGDQVLRFLGRDHDGARARTALELAVNSIPYVSADLIYGWAGQNSGHWQSELKTGLQMGINHISTYQLTIEAGTAFSRAAARGEEKAVNGDVSADLHELTLDVLRSHGFVNYEVSNFARSAKDRSRHNLVYWLGGDYIGVGPGAHGRLTRDGKRIATVAYKKPKSYISSVRQSGHGIQHHETLAPSAWAEEYVLMGLRIDEGISRRRFKEISRMDFDQVISTRFADAGFLNISGDRIHATQSGRLVLDRICTEFLSGLKG